MENLVVPSKSQNRLQQSMGTTQQQEVQQNVPRSQAQTSNSIQVDPNFLLRANISYGARSFDFVARKCGLQDSIPFKRYFEKSIVPLIANSEWTEDEDQRLTEMVQLHGFNWDFLESYFPGRTKEFIRKQWFSTSHRKINGEPVPNEILEKEDDLFIENAIWLKHDLPKINPLDVPGDETIYLE